MSRLFLTCVLAAALSSLPGIAGAATAPRAVDTCPATTSAAQAAIKGLPASPPKNDWVTFQASDFVVQGITPTEVAVQYFDGDIYALSFVLPESARPGLDKALRRQFPGEALRCDDAFCKGEAKGWTKGKLHSAALFKRSGGVGLSCTYSSGW